MSQPNQKHVFISHAHKDSAAANAVVAALEQRGVPCWIAPRNVPPGGSYAEAILTAIETASCFVLIYSEHSNVSSHVLREVERALKFGVNIVPVRLDDSAPSKSLDYLLATVHWLSIPAESRERSIARAAEQIASWLTNFLKNPAAPLPVRMTPLQTALVTSLEPPPKRRGMLVGATLLLFALAAAGAVTTGRLPLFKQAETKATSETNSPVPASTGSTQAIVQSSSADDPFHARKKRRIGYAGVTNPAVVRPNPPADPIYSTANQPRPPLPRSGMENSTGNYGGPPPPPGASMPEHANRPGPGGPPAGRFPPPPPPRPGGPMSGRPDGPGPNGPLPPGGPPP